MNASLATVLGLILLSGCGGGGGRGGGGGGGGGGGSTGGGAGGSNRTAASATDTPALGEKRLVRTGVDSPFFGHLGQAPDATTGSTDTVFLPCPPPEGDPPAAMVLLQTDVLSDVPGNCFRAGDFHAEPIIRRELAKANFSHDDLQRSSAAAASMTITHAIPIVLPHELLGKPKN